MIVNAANKYGMTETENYSEWVQMITDDSTTYHSVYYVMDDSEEANKWYYASYLVAENSIFPDIQVNECILGFEKISDGAADVCVIAGMGGLFGKPDQELGA